MGQHTKGPWKRGSCDGSIIWAKSFNSTSFKHCPDDPNDEGVAVASVGRVPLTGLPTFKWDAAEAESKANALLVAASPDLLDAAKKVMAGLVARIEAAPSNSVPVFDGIAELHDAINKAEGRT